MPTLTEYFKWWVTDEGSGKQRLTSFKLTRADAERAFPGSDPDLLSRELRNLADPGDAPPTSRPGRHWS